MKHNFPSAAVVIGVLMVNNNENTELFQGCIYAIKTLPHEPLLHSVLETGHKRLINVCLNLKYFKCKKQQTIIICIRRALMT